MALHQLVKDVSFLETSCGYNVTLVQLVLNYKSQYTSVKVNTQVRKSVHKYKVNTKVKSKKVRA